MQVWEGAPFIHVGMQMSREGIKEPDRCTSTAAPCCAGIPAQTPGLSRLAASRPQLSGAVSLEQVGAVGRQGVPFGAACPAANR